MIFLPFNVAAETTGGVGDLAFKFQVKQVYLIRNGLLSFYFMHLLKLGV